MTRFVFRFAFFFAGALSTPVFATTTTFPPNFEWCVSTAAHQIEGGNTASDHYVWETSAPYRVLTRELFANPELETSMNLPGPSLAKACPQAPTGGTAGPYPQNTHEFSDPQTRQKIMCEYSGRAADHWNRVAEDVQHIKKLNVKQYRFSVEWAKIEPREGTFDETALQHYRNEIEQLLQNGIEPQVTLFHFTLPQWVREKGGWENPESPRYFQRFTEKVYASFGPRVKTWYTLNEPMVHLVAGYVAGVLPPGLTDVSRAVTPLKNLLRAHALSYHALHAGAARAGIDIRVGIAHHLRVFDPGSPDSAAEQVVAKVADEVWNWMFIDAVETGHLVFDLTWAKRIHFPLPQGLVSFTSEIADLKGSEDFLGVNYYTRDFIHVHAANLFNGRISSLIELGVNPAAVRAGLVNDMGWEIYPAGLTRILEAANKRVQTVSGRKLAVIISENGIADRFDTKRKMFIAGHLEALKRAMDEGVDVRGYCHWSLLDNFEWNSGYYPRFGLYMVDYRTLRRTARPSALWFAEVMRTGRLETEDGDARKSSGENK